MNDYLGGKSLDQLIAESLAKTKPLEQLLQEAFANELPLEELIAESNAKVDKLIADGLFGIPQNLPVPGESDRR